MILVHKASKGILTHMPWEGRNKTFNNKSVATYQKINADNLKLLNLDLDEWWIVDEKAQSSLAYKLKLYYPFFDPIEENGELLDIKRWDKCQVYGEDPLIEKVEDNKPKKRKRRMITLKLG